MDRGTAEEITEACLIVLGVIGFGGWFLNRRTGADHDVRPFTHQDWSKRYPEKLGVGDDVASDWMTNKGSFLALFKSWIRVLSAGSNLSFMVSGPLKKADLASMQDFASTHRAGDVTVDVRFGGRGVYRIPWKDFLGVDLGGLRAYKS